MDINRTWILHIHVRFFRDYGFAMKKTDYFLQELPQAPKELREEFPGKFHLWFLWAIIRANENSIRQRLPCRLSYHQIGVLLAREMGYQHPYTTGTITKYIGLLRNKGWVKTFRIVFPNERVTPRNPSRIGKLQINYPVQQFVNYARSLGCGRSPIITCIFGNSKINFEKEKGGFACPSRINSPGCLLFTNINNSIEKELYSFCEAKEKEIRGIINLSGFHTYFDKSDIPTESRLADAKLLHNRLIECKVGVGQRVSLNKWASQLEKTSHKYPNDYQTVFNWLISTIPNQEWLSNMIQSPSSFHKKFLRLKKKMEETPKSKIPDGYLDNIDYVTEQSEIIRKEFPKECCMMDEIGEHELGLAIYNMKHWLSVSMESPLDRLVDMYGKNSDMWNIAVKLRKDVEDDDTFLIGIRRLLNGLKNSPNWKGYFRKGFLIGVIDNGQGRVLNKHAREWFIWLMKKRGEHETRRHNLILNAINEELNNED